MDTQPLTFVLSEGEQVVRTFECTRMRRLFASDVIGYLSITNQRVVYHSLAKSAAGESRILSEMPLEDVAGISASLNASFNWLILLGVAAVLYVVNVVAFQILPGFLTHWAVALFLMVPYGLVFLFERQILNPQLRNQFLENLKDVPGSTLWKEKEPGFFIGIFRILFFIGLDLLAWNIVQSLLRSAPLIGFLIVLVVAVIIYRLFFGRFKVFSLQISSRTAKDSGITIAGMPILGLLGGDHTAAQTLQAGPGSDAEIIVRDLGAMLTDIRQLGDLGIQKWTNLPGG